MSKTITTIAKPKPIKPVFPYMGGKTKLLPALRENMPTGYINFHEPFLGGGALALDEMAKNGINGRKYFLSDFDQNVVDAWTAVKECPQELAQHIETMMLNHCRTSFMEIRSWDKNGILDGKTLGEKGARFIYLMHTSFGAQTKKMADGSMGNSYSWKLNSSNGMRAYDFENMHAVSALLNSLDVTIFQASYETALQENANYGDFIYLDPPYANSDDMESTAGCRNAPISHANVQKHINELTALGCMVLLSDADTADIRDQYKGWACSRPQSVWQAGGVPRVGAELLVSNWRLADNISRNLVDESVEVEVEVEVEVNRSSHPRMFEDELTGYSGILDFNEKGIDRFTGRYINTFGFTANGNHFRTKTPLDVAGCNIDGWHKDGWHRSGWHPKGLNRKTGTLYDSDGIDIDGFDQEGWSEWYPFQEREYLQSTYETQRRLPKHKETGTTYAPDGFNIFGYDHHGYDRQGYDRIGDYGTHVGYDRNGYNPQGFNEKGYDRHGFSKNGRDKFGFDHEGTHVSTETMWAPDGRNGVTKTNFDIEGYDLDGFDSSGYKKDGYNRDGWNSKDIHKDTCTVYDINGFSRAGLDKNGMNSRGIDGTYWSNAVEKMPSRIYALEAWNHHIIQNKLKTDDGHIWKGIPRNLYREGWRHTPGQGFSVGSGKYDAGNSFTHFNTKTKWNPEGFNVIGINAERVNERGFNLATGLHQITGTEYDENGCNLLLDTMQV